METEFSALSGCQPDPPVSSHTRRFPLVCPTVELSQIMMTNLQGSRRGLGHGCSGQGPVGHSFPTGSPPMAMGTGSDHFLALLSSHRELILKKVTEGRLNAALDALRSRQALSRASYEAICSVPTLTARIRALLDTCLSLGEEATQVALAVLLDPPRQRLRELPTIWGP
ncbi:receptor-interacting serine/threonine-protein kinase 2-like [Sarcophilus harrisii]